MQADKEKSETSDETLLRVARERFKLAEEAYSDIHREARDDDRFRVGDQWPDEVRSERKRDSRPCLTVNRLPQFVRQITNDQRQNDPAIRYSPVDDKSDLETAKVYQGLTRHIEDNSNASSAYDSAFDGAASKGFGYFRITTDYVSPTSFLQEIRYKKITDHYSVYLDPAHKETDGSDANWAFVFEDMPKEDFIAQYGESKLAVENDWKTASETSEGWVDESTVRVAEYYYRDFKKETLYLLNDGEAYLEKDLKQLAKDGLLPAGLEILDERETTTSEVKWVKFAGDEILERTTWPSQWIPIIPVYGEELWVDGKRVLEGVIRHAKDPQRMLNYWVSAETEAIALAPKSPYLVAEGQLEGHEADWREANRKPVQFLQYRQKDVDGKPAPMPQRVQAEANVMAITNARMQSSEDLKATTGIYDAAMGAQSNEKSGIAIQRRANQAQISNYHLVDNLSKSIKHGGRILAQLIPVIYDSSRAQRILAEDGEAEIIQLNQEFERDGKPVMYDLSRGKYDVTVETGPSYATKRQEAAASMLEMAKVNPQIFAAAGDLFVKYQDWEGSQEIAERLKRTMPPELVDDKKKPVEIPPQIKAQMDQMGQLVDQLTAQLNEAKDVLSTKTLELESKERIEMMKLETQINLKKLELGSLESRALLDAQIQEINQRQAQLRSDVPIGVEAELPPQQDFMGFGPDQAAIPPVPQPTDEMSGPYIGE